MGAPKPKGHITYKTEQGYTNTLWVPQAVCRALKKELPGEEMTEEDFFSLVDKVQKSCALKKIASMVERRDHAIKEAQDKLYRDGYSQPIVELAVKRACEFKILDDKRFAELFISSKKMSGWGRNRIERELKLKKVDPYELEGYPYEFFSEDDELERAKNLLARKSIPEKNAYPKLYRFLASKGFQPSIISTAVKDKLSDDVDDCLYPF